jgi:hypothetical protein
MRKSYNWLIFDKGVHAFAAFENAAGRNFLPRRIMELPIGSRATQYVNGWANGREVMLAALSCPWKPWGGGEKI